jgi:hypothetical protein
MSTEEVTPEFAEEYTDILACANRIIYLLGASDAKPIQVFMNTGDNIDVSLSSPDMEKIQENSRILCDYLLGMKHNTHLREIEVVAEKKYYLPQSGEMFAKPAHGKKTVSEENKVKTIVRFDMKKKNLSKQHITLMFCETKPTIGKGMMNVIHVFYKRYTKKDVPSIIHLNLTDNDTDDEDMYGLPTDTTDQDSFNDQDNQPTQNNDQGDESDYESDGDEFGLALQQQNNYQLIQQETFQILTQSEHPHLPSNDDDDDFNMISDDFLSSFSESVPMQEDDRPILSSDFSFLENFAPSDFYPLPEQSQTPAEPMKKELVLPTIRETREEVLEEIQVMGPTKAMFIIESKSIAHQKLEDWEELDRLLNEQKQQTPAIAPIDIFDPSF